jgi:hypothetical protein
LRIPKRTVPSLKAIFSVVSAATLRSRRPIDGLYDRIETNALLQPLFRRDLTRERNCEAPHGTCLRYPPAVEALGLVRRGDAAALRRLLARAPDILASAPCAAKLLRLAVDRAG